MKRANRLLAVLALGISSLALAAAPPPAPGAAQNRDGFDVGQKVQPFVLRDTEGKEHDLQKYLDEGKVVVLEWFNPDCPFVKMHHTGERNMSRTYAFAREHGVVWLAINSGAPGKQGAGLDRNRRAKEEYKIAYPILLDESGKVGRMFGAKTTPDMRIISKDGILVYRGAIDNGGTREGRRLPMAERTNYVIEALKAHLAGETVKQAKTRPYGCSVKY